MLLSVAVLIAWPLVMHRFFPAPPEPAPEEQPLERPSPPPSQPAQPPQTAHTQTQPPPAPATPPKAQMTARVPGRELVVETRYWTARLSNRGAIVTSWVINSYPRDGEKRGIRPAEGEVLELIPQDLPEGVTKPFG